jgi:hypothetical protein
MTRKIWAGSLRLRSGLALAGLSARFEMTNLRPEMSNLGQFCVWDAAYYLCELTSPWPVAEEVMENYADLMQRLLEIQSGERQNPKLIAEDERLMRSLQKRNLAGKPTQRLDLSEE